MAHCVQSQRPASDIYISISSFFINHRRSLDGRAIEFYAFCGSNTGRDKIFYFRFREVYGKTFLVKVVSIINAVI